MLESIFALKDYPLGILNKIMETVCFLAMCKCNIAIVLSMWNFIFKSFVCETFIDNPLCAKHLLIITSSLSLEIRRSYYKKECRVSFTYIQQQQQPSVSGL